MSQPGESSRARPRPGSPVALCHSPQHKVSVLLADTDSHSLEYIASLLESCSYEVTKVGDPGNALYMLVEENKQFDLVLADIQSPNLDVFKLIQTAVKRGILVVLISSTQDVQLARKAIDDGIFLYVEKPIIMETIKYLWQSVERERKRKMEIDGYIDRLDKLTYQIVNSHKNSQVRKNKLKRKSKDRNYNDQDKEILTGNTKKLCTEWTSELHKKFMDAVNQLGEGCCYPKEILEIMNMPGLTRMQVASHLQKCRNDSWRAPEERKQSSANSKQFANNQPQCKNIPRKFGTKPSVTKPSSEVRSPERLESSRNANTGLPFVQDFFSEQRNGMDQLVNYPQSHQVPQGPQHFKANRSELNMTMQRTGQFTAYMGNTRNGRANNENILAGNQRAHELGTGFELNFHQDIYQQNLSNQSSASSSNERAPAENFFNGGISGVGDFLLNNTSTTSEQSNFDFNQFFNN